ncbi:MAG: efflux RND transporter periplasmic adaptor subunit [Thauera phenolivorans]|uniref:Efflux RND transporter periplasmic adaptor subunit n=1 Tax=Thauera phenolivorans TaxID=1792543 RepID=A0A7X7LZB1_9RHOO|nr:efflux RND transporter periplasmic adaptor subunit [Thauera phenolivorans]
MKPASPPRPAPRWKRPLLGLAALCVLAALVWTGWRAMQQREDGLAAYQLATVARGDIEDVVTATGTLQPRNYVDVGAQVSGQLERIHVEVGSEVEQGQLLAEIDPTVYRARVDASRAQLRNLRAQLKDREAQLALARIQFRRQTALMAEDATTRESVQSAEATQKSAAAQLEALRAQIEQIESTLRADEANLEYADILSPMSGTVVSITARQGQTLNTNQQAPVILRVADLSTMTVQTEVSEADVGRLRLGMEAYFTTLGGGSERWRGKLEKIEPTPTVTNNVVLYNALFDVPNPDGRLMTQMTAQVFFVVAQAENALVVPMAALAQGAPRARGAQAAARAVSATPADESRPAVRRGTVRVVGARGALEERAVEIGVANRVQAEIRSGLAEGDQVVAGLARAANGAGGAAGRTPRL